MAPLIPAPKTKVHAVKGVMTDNLTILLFGPTGSGKTPMIGELAEYLYKHYKLTTRLYASDRGGWETIRPYVELGIIDVHPLFGDPFEWLSNVVLGRVFNGKDWVDGLDPKIGLYAFEGLTSMSDHFMSWMSAASARGVNIGGGGAFSFKAGEKNNLVIGTNNMAHYGVAQQRVRDQAWLSQNLPGMVLWTAGDKRGEDDSAGAVVGPQLAGKSLTGEVPMWFKYTFRLAKELAYGQENKHVLYLEDHIELAAKMAPAISNARIPLAAGKIESKVEPASVVKALEMIHEAQGKAKDAIKARLGL